MQVVRALAAVLLFTSEAKVAAAADAAREPHADKLADLYVVTYTGPEGHDSADALVAADMGQLDL